jgi:hypothetical protein
VHCWVLLCYWLCDATLAMIKCAHRMDVTLGITLRNTNANETVRQVTRGLK